MTSIKISFFIFILLLSATVTSQSLRVVTEDLTEHYLKDNGRTDLAFTNDIMWQHELEGTGLDPSKIKFVYQIPNFAADLYLAASLDIDNVTIERLKSALSQMKADGEYQAILRKWHINSNQSY